MEELQYNLFVEKCIPELVNRGYYLLYNYIPAINSHLLSFLKNGQLIDIENVKVGKKCMDQNKNYISIIFTKVLSAFSCFLTNGLVSSQT